MNVVNQLTEEQIKQLHALYAGEWWCKDRTLEQARRCVNGSQLIIGLTDDAGTLCAFTRVLTDFTFKALIFDVIVHRDYRKENLGIKLIDLVKTHSKLSQVKHFELYCLPELFAFYERHGFSEDVGGMRLMRFENESAS